MHLFTIVAVSFILIARQQAAELLVNGGFENEPYWGDTSVGYDGNFTALTGSEIPGWTIVPGHAVSVSVTPGRYRYPVISGAYSVNTDGEGFTHHNADFYQDFPTTPDVSYNFSFDWEVWMRPANPPSLEVSIEDLTTHTFVYDVLFKASPPSLVVQHVSATFLGNGHPYRLEIKETPESGINDNSFMVDNFSVSGPSLPSAFTYHNFSDAHNLRFGGSATNLATTDGAVLQLTPSSADQVGSAFYAAPISLPPNAAFSTFFTFRLGKPGGSLDTDSIQGGEGIAFLIQSGGVRIGQGAGGLGYGGMTNSLAVEFDTFNNAAQSGSPGDLNGNHVALNINGTLTDQVAVAVTNGALNNGNVWYAWIDYNGARYELQVRLSQTPVRPADPTLAALVNLPAVLGNAHPLVGFTGSTGAAYNEQDILSWKFMPLATTRFTGHSALSAASSLFSLTNGFVYKTYAYQVTGVAYTNFYLFRQQYTTELDGSLSFVTEPESTPSRDPAAGPQTTALMMMSQYLNADPDSPSSGLAIPMSTPAPEGQTFEQTFPGAAEQDVLLSFGDSIGSLGSTDGSPPIAPMVINPDLCWTTHFDLEKFLQIGCGNPAAQIGDQVGGQLGSQMWTSDANIPLVTYSGATNRGSVMVREQLISGPPQPLKLLFPGQTGTAFTFGFLTSFNQPYTVWSSTDLAPGTWAVSTNFVGDGYSKTFTMPTNGALNQFYRASTP